MKTKIEEFVNFNGLMLGIEEFHQAWLQSKSNRKLEKLPFKHGASQWNDGHTSYKPKSCYALKVYGKDEETGYWDYFVVGIYEVWERVDGLGKRIFCYQTMKDYESYIPDDNIPHNIKNELGLCGDYHKGI